MHPRGREPPGVRVDAPVRGAREVGRVREEDDAEGALAVREPRLRVSNEKTSVSAKGELKRSVVGLKPIFESLHERPRKKSLSNQ